MDWKGYGIVQQCGTCEPLQNPTSSSRMLSDEIDEEKRGTKVPRTRRRKSQPALWWSRLEFREIELSG